MLLPPVQARPPEHWPAHTGSPSAAVCPAAPLLVPRRLAEALQWVAVDVGRSVLLLKRPDEQELPMECFRAAHQFLSAVSRLGLSADRLLPFLQAVEAGDLAAAMCEVRWAHEQGARALLLGAWCGSAGLEHWVLDPHPAMLRAQAPRPPIGFCSLELP